jgi:diadenosine tetraphosphate (Ap4A) HIT family hydrolase
LSESSLFELHPRLAADCGVVGDLPLCRLLLMDDSRFPWCILVPRATGLRELHDLSGSARGALFDEIEAVSRALLEIDGVQKINVGALGNLVPQLHVHVVGRHPGDAAWPGPVWGAGTAVAYERAAREKLMDRLRAKIFSR